MKIQIMAVVMCMLCDASTALAAATDGAFVQAGADITRAASDIEFTGWFRDEVSDTALDGTIAAGFARSFGRFHLAASVSRILGSRDAGRTVQDSPFSASERNDTVSVELRNAWSINLQPGRQVGGRGLLYGKLSYSEADGRWRFSRPLYGDSFSGEIPFRGFGLGLGYRRSLGSRLFAFTELQHTWYAKRDVPVTVTTSGITSTYIDRFGAATSAVAVGLGARF